MSNASWCTCLLEKVLRASCILEAIWLQFCVVMLGVRQRLGANEGEESKPSAAVAFLKSTYASGRLPASDLSLGAKAIVRDQGNAAPSDVQRLAHVAPQKERKRKGVNQPAKDTRNCSRDVRRALASQSSLDLPPIVNIDCPLWDQEKEACESTPVSFLLPHLLLDSVQKGREHEFCSIPVDRPELREELQAWGDRAGVDVNSGTPVAACSLWGDGAVYDNRDSLQLLILSLLTGVRVRRWWVCGFGKQRLCRCGCHGPHTFDYVLSILAWSFRALAASWDSLKPS